MRNAKNEQPTTTKYNECSEKWRNHRIPTYTSHKSRELHAWRWTFSFRFQFSPLIWLRSCVQCPYVSQWSLSWNHASNYSLRPQHSNNTRAHKTKNLCKRLTIVSTNCHKISLAYQSHDMPITWTWSRALNHNPAGWCHQYKWYSSNLISTRALKQCITILRYFHT